MIEKMPPEGLTRWFHRRKQPTQRSGAAVRFDRRAKHHLRVVASIDKRVLRVSDFTPFRGPGPVVRPRLLDAGNHVLVTAPNRIVAGALTGACRSRASTHSCLRRPCRNPLLQPLPSKTPESLKAVRSATINEMEKGRLTLVATAMVRGEQSYADQIYAAVDVAAAKVEAG